MPAPIPIPAASITDNGTQRRAREPCAAGVDRGLEAIAGAGHGRDEAVAFAGQRLDEARLFGGIPQRFPEMVHRLVQAPIEVDERAGAPEPVPQLFACDQFARLFQQRQE